MPVDRDAVDLLEALLVALALRADDRDDDSRPHASVRASCQTRRSNGHGRFSTMIRTRRPLPRHRRPRSSLRVLRLAIATLITSTRPDTARSCASRSGSTCDVEQQLIRARVRLRAPPALRASSSRRPARPRRAPAARGRSVISDAMCGMLSSMKRRFAPISRATFTCGS